MKTPLLPLAVLLTALAPVFAAPTDLAYAAHEWGTFTSVQGADGVQMDWNPLTVSELPKFVYERSRAGAKRGFVIASKTGITCRQRMETPVIYFYADHEVSVNVDVKFPQGIVTEWFPQVSKFGPYYTTNKEEVALSQQSFVRWNNVRVLPQAALTASDRALPSDASGSHYFAARETDANILRFASEKKTEHEKFLFYRGIGNFQAPLQMTMGGDEENVRLKNTGKEELRHLFILSIHGAQGKFISVDRLAPGEEQTLKVSPGMNETTFHEWQSSLRQKIETSLVAEGLYQREASAMVQTWNDSWFSENGLRVLYILPRTWTDRILPITLSPPPRELARVMVGRAEMITPAMEWTLLKQVVKFSDTDLVARNEAIGEMQKLGLGRFLEPAVRRVLGKNPSREFNQQAGNLMNATTASRP